MTSDENEKSLAPEIFLFLLDLPSGNLFGSRIVMKECLSCTKLPSKLISPQGCFPPEYKSTHRLSLGTGKAGGCSGEWMMWAMVVLQLMLCALILEGWWWGRLLGHPGLSERAEMWALLKSEQYCPIFHPETSHYCLHLPWLYFLIFFLQLSAAVPFPYSHCYHYFLDSEPQAWIAAFSSPTVSLQPLNAFLARARNFLSSEMTGPLQV